MGAPELAVGAVVVDDDHLLLVRRARDPGAGTWAVPGGRVVVGETLAEAVTRELREETGLEGACGALIGWSELVGEEPGQPHVVILAFEASLFEAGEPRAGSDATDARWVHLGDVADQRLAPGLAELLAEHGVIATIT